jgi:hypothetical protein
MALRAVAQRDHYEPQARVEVFQGLAEYYRSLAAFPAGEIEGLSDEEYVKSALRAIYAEAGVASVQNGQWSGAHS